MKIIPIYTQAIEEETVGSCSPTKRRKELEHLATKEGQIRDYVNAIDQSTSIFL